MTRIIDHGHSGGLRRSMRGVAWIVATVAVVVAVVLLMVVTNKHTDRAACPGLYSGSTTGAAAGTCDAVQALITRREAG